jgi:3-hydroxyacyl-[acyl-carrier-protein] dehydratase
MIMDRAAIEAVIPHRDPFVMIDGVLELNPGRTIVAFKNVLPEEEYFKGHFPGNPVMPGVLIVESIAQAGAVCMLSTPEFAGCTAYFAGIDKVRFKRKVLPGEQLRLEVTIGRMRGRIGFGTGKAYVGDELAVLAEIMFAIG